MADFDPVSYMMGQKAAGGGGGGGGSSTLSGLTDVDISNPTDGQTLVYNATSGKWENGAGGGYKVFEVTFMAVEYGYIFSVPCISITPEGVTTLVLYGEAVPESPFTAQVISFSDFLVISPAEFQIDMSYMPVCTGGVELVAQGFKVSGDGTITCKGRGGN